MNLLAMKSPNALTMMISGMDISANGKRAVTDLSGI